MQGAMLYPMMIYDYYILAAFVLLEKIMYACNTLMQIIIIDETFQTYLETHCQP